MGKTSKQPQYLGSDLNHWFSSGLGRMVLDAEQELVGEWSADLFGYQLLEMSLFHSDLSYLDPCAIKNKIHICPSPGHEMGQLKLRAIPEQLPVATDYIDAVVLLHTLDFATDPHQVLREVERVLIPEGRLIVAGFNPFSLWGMRRRLPGASGRLPWSGKFISYTRLQDWFSLLGFDVERVEARMFRPPVKYPNLPRKLERLEAAGQKWMPRLAGVYVVQAVKRVSTVTPVRPHWRLQPKLGKAVIEPGSSMKPTQ